MTLDSINKISFFIFILSLTIPTVSFANTDLTYEIKECGHYQTFGTAEKIRDRFFISVFKSSKSEIKIEITDQTKTKLLPYIGREIESSIKIEKLIVVHNLEASVESINDNISSAVRLENRQGFKLTKKIKCKK